MKIFSEYIRILVYVEFENLELKIVNILNDSVEVGR